MTPAPQAPSLDVPPEVHSFAEEQGVRGYLPAVLEMTRGLFPSVPIIVQVEDDPEIANDRHIVLVVRPKNMNVSQALDVRWEWHRGLFACCPAPLVPVFRLGLEFTE